MREFFPRATNHTGQRLADSALRTRPVIPLHSFFSRGFFKIVWVENGVKTICKITHSCEAVS
jgi:hypothetical protein